MKRCRIWAAVLSVSVAVPFTGCSHMPTSMLPTAAREKVLDSKMAVAQELEGKKEFKKAKKVYESIHNADPRHALACHRLAIVNYRLGQREEALNYFKKAETLTPENSELLSDYGYALYKLKQYKQAEVALKKSVEFNPKSERAITRLATVFGSQGKMQESYTQLCKISTPAEAHEIVAHLHGERGEKQQALSHYQKSLELSRLEIGGNRGLKKGSPEYKVNEQLLKRVEKNIAQLSSDPTLKSNQSQMQLVAHSRNQKRKSDLKSAGSDKKFYQKVTEKLAHKTAGKKSDNQHQATKKESPFRVIRERLVKSEQKTKVENPQFRNPFLNDPILSESAFKEVQTEVATNQVSRSKMKQQRVLLDEVLAQSASSPDVQEKVAFRRITEEEVNRATKPVAGSRQTAVVTNIKQVARVDARSDEKSIEKIVRKRRSAYELMRELQNELISDFSPEEAESGLKEQLEFRDIRPQEVANVENVNSVRDDQRAMGEKSPFDEQRISQIGKWKLAEPVSNRLKNRQTASIESSKTTTQPVVQSRKPMILNASMSQPKREVIQPLTAATMCPDAEGEVLELVKKLDSNDIPLIKQTVQRLGSLQADARASRPALRPLLQHENMGVRIQSAFSLWKIEGGNEDSIPTLIDAMNSSVESDRSFAAAVLAQIGIQSEELTPILVRSLSDNNEYVRLHTAELLSQNSSWNYQANKTLAECLLSKDVNIRWLAAYSLADLRPEDDRIIAALSIALQDKASQVRAGAAYALGEIGSYAHKSIPELQKARFDSNSEVRIAAKNALSRVRRVRQVSPPSAN